MMYIGDLIAVADYLPFQGMRISAGPVVNDPIPDLPGQIQSSSGDSGLSESGGEDEIHHGYEGIHQSEGQE